MVERSELQAVVAESAEGLEVPGVVVGVHHEGEEHYAVHGVTSIEHPLPVDETTLFSIGSTGKTFTGTALVRLAERGEVDLGAPVRTYAPELRLKDESVARDVTVLHLLNHTAGWGGDLEVDTGDGDDAVARFVEAMADLDQVTPLGGIPSYNNAALVLAGRVIEKVTGGTYEAAIRDLLLGPLGLDHSFFEPNDVMTRRFAVGHQQHADGRIAVIRPWAPARSVRPAGTLASTAPDQIAWARFHLGDGRSRSGDRVLSEEAVRSMQRPTTDPGLTECYGITWMLRDVEGLGLVEHGGDGSGQHSAFAMAPERDFAITVLTNCGPNGQELRGQLVRWALEAYLGVVERDPEPLELGEDELAAYTGSFETLAAVLHISVEGDGLLAVAELKPEAIAQEVEAGEEPPNPPPPFRLVMVAGGADRYLVKDGPYQGMQGYFVRDAGGTVEAVHVGRLATRVAEPARA